MAIDVFTEDYLVAASNLAATRQAKAEWGKALVRTDLDNEALNFLARSFRGCVEREKEQVRRYKDAAGILSGFSKR